MRRDLEHVQDMVDAAQLTLSYVRDATLESFRHDTLCQDAVIRRIELIGEAARRVSDQTRSAHPEVPWAVMIAMRNLMIHDYDDVDMDIVWDTVQQDLPDLVDQLTRLAGFLKDTEQE
jgi:uncharacterized protein with HEPN domain